MTIFDEGRSHLARQLVFFAIVLVIHSFGFASEVRSGLSEKAAISAVDQVWKEWSTPNGTALRLLSQRYDDEVTFYGQKTSKAKVMHGKNEFAQRWPERTYTLAPNSVEVTCESSRSFCVVSGRVYWDARSVQRGTQAIGLASFELGIRPDPTGFRIVSETGHVIANKTLTLRAAPGDSADSFGTLLSPLQQYPKISSLRTTQIAKAVLFCFNQGRGTLTIQQMFDCSGVWVTPRSLMRCAMGTQCPALPDTLIGRATLKATLNNENLTLASVLSLRPSDLPPMPSFDQIRRCKGASANDSEFKQCALKELNVGDYAQLQECLRIARSPDARTTCITTPIKDEQLHKMATCLGTRAPEADIVVDCLADKVVADKAKAIRKCAANQASLANTAGCVATDLPENQKKVVACLAAASGGQNARACVEQISPEVAKAAAVVDCLHADSKIRSKKISACVAKIMPGDAGKALECLNKDDQLAASRCLIGDTPEARAAEQLYNCAAKGRDAISVVEHCTTALNLDPKTQMTLACAAKADGDRSKLASCAAGAVLPPEAARYVGCATTSQGPTSFALCAASPQMNEEWRIAAECAVQSAGEPTSTATCATTRLTIRELTACFTGQIGKDCFGPNNTIIVVFRNQFNDLLHGPGKNNDVVKTIAVIASSVQRLDEEGRKFVEKPLGGKGALIPKARDDALDALGVGGTGRKVIENPFDPRKWF